MSALKSIVITVPKRLTSKTPVFAGQKLNFATSLIATEKSLVKPSRNMSTVDDDVVTLDDSPLGQGVCFRGKKRRLDHLTWEEKIQRKKLKNRVAAQTSRDRKRAKLDELEDTVRGLKDKNDALAREVLALKSQNETLVAQNSSLRRDVESRTTEERLCSECQSRVGCVAPMPGSAVSPQYPLPQGGATKSAPVLTLTQPAATLWKILTLYLLSKNCLPTSKGTTISKDSKSWPKAFCEKLPQKWKQMLISQVNKSSSGQIPPKNLAIKQEWWGRHQKMWKPIELVEA